MEDDEGKENNSEKKGGLEGEGKSYPIESRVLDLLTRPGGGNAILGGPFRFCKYQKKDCIGT